MEIKAAGLLGTLPAELRIVIYKHLFFQPDKDKISRAYLTQIQSNSTDARFDPPKRRSSQLLRTCKFIYHDARTMLYGLSTSILPSQWDTITPLRELCPNISSDALKLIKNYEIGRLVVRDALTLASLVQEWEDSETLRHVKILVSPNVENSVASVGSFLIDFFSDLQKGAHDTPMDKVKGGEGCHWEMEVKSQTDGAVNNSMCYEYRVRCSFWTTHRRVVVDSLPKSVIIEFRAR